MEALESFHFEIRIESRTPTNINQNDLVFPPVTMVGDVRVPDSIHIAISGFLEAETIAIGSTQYQRIGGGRWGPASELDEDDQPSMIARPWTVLAPLEPEDIEDLGEVTLDGTRTHHLRGRYSAMSFPDQEEVGDLTLEVWIGVEDGLWRQPQTQVEAESTEGTVTSVLEFSAFDEPVVIGPPEQEALLVHTLSMRPSEPVPGQPIFVGFVAENVSSAAPLETTIDVLVDGETVRTFTVSDLALGANRAFEFELTLEAGDHQLQVGLLDVEFAVLDPSERPKDPSVSLSLSPSSVLPGEPVAITVTLEAGDALLDRKVDVFINGEALRSFVVAQMQPGTSETFTVEVARSEPGHYSVLAHDTGGGLSSAAFRVNQAEPSPTTKTPTTPAQPTPPDEPVPAPAPPPTPTPTATPTPMLSGTALPLGTLHQVTDEECSGSSGDQCKRAVVTCPGVDDVAVNLRVTGAGTDGTILLTTGGRGTRWYRTGEEGNSIHAMMDTLLDDGYTLVEIAWVEPGVWEGPGGTISLACRSATAFHWVHDNIHQGGFLAAQGNSGGSAQIAFSLAYYGVDEILDLANLSGGPPPCPISTEGRIDFQQQEQCVVEAEGWDESKEPMLSGDPRLHYPNTIVRFFLGENEPTAYIIETAKAYHAAITSEKSLQTVPNTANGVPFTEEGTTALITSINPAFQPAPTPTPTPTVVASTPTTTEVELSHTYFEPSELTISEGDIVIFRNIETMSHPLVNQELGLDTGDFTRGELSITFDQAGSFTIINTAHGTTITVVVQGDGS